MALVLLDRVQQTGTANTTVSFTVTGSVAGYQSWSAVGNGNTTYYGASDASGNWEVGLATYSTTGPTVTRTTIFASSNGGAAVTFSGTVNVWVDYPATKAVYLDASGNFGFNSGYGSIATAYGCRAWVSFNGASGASPVIRGSGNVTSVTRTGTGAYTVALTTAMPDTNYAITAIGSTDTAGTGRFFGAYPNSTSSILVASNQSTGTALDVTIASIAIFR